MLTLGKRAAALLLALGLAAPVLAQDRTAEEILKEYDAVQTPQFDREKLGDQEAIQEYLQARQKAVETKSALAQELYRAAPDHERVPRIMIERWMGGMTSPDQAEEIIEEINQVLAETKNEELRTQGAFARAYLKMMTSRGDAKATLDAVEEFSQTVKDDSEGLGAQLLYMALRTAQDPEQKSALEDRILKDYPDSPFGEMIQGDRRRREAVGKPFELEFQDAISGKTISMADLKGKVVVVDFWATWCGPCIAEMPQMKEIYAKYKDQGVEFLGVSLDAPEDEGGLTALKNYVKENDIAWPQYYQGKGWEGEFSRSWGINSIPAMFVVDAEGNLYSVEARGRLEELIPELIEKRDTAADKPTAPDGSK